MNGKSLVIKTGRPSIDFISPMDVELMQARLVNGRKQQYEVAGASPQEEEGFVTLIRYGPHTPQGKATALFNFKISATEVLPEEDVVLVLLLCTATMRSIADFGGLSAGNEYIRRRMKENNPGSKDWGSVVLENTARHSNLAYWYWNCERTTDEDDGDGENHPGMSNLAPYHLLPSCYLNENLTLYTYGLF